MLIFAGEKRVCWWFVVVVVVVVLLAACSWTGLRRNQSPRSFQIAEIRTQRRINRIYIYI